MKHLTKMNKYMSCTSGKLHPTILGYQIEKCYYRNEGDLADPYKVT
jgi:hypothetical protein